jgi:oxygen-independent coproporphyrinogen-3 oxidase
MNLVYNFVPAVAGIPDDFDVDGVAAALGPSASLAYSPPHDYPMSVPALIKSPGEERARPVTDRLRLYAHIPFCNYACSYCFFAKKIGAKDEEMANYVDALVRELEWIEPGTPLDQLFVGGGTPTALAPDLLNRVLSAIFERMSRDGSQVHTLETSPESLTQGHIDILRHHRIGRISMGVQSLDDRVLDAVNRRHTIDQALSACTRLVENGFIVNVDLIYGLPGQTHESFRCDLETVAATGIQSVTLYDLRINERTPVSKIIDSERRLNLSRLMHWRAFIKKAAAKLGFTQTRWHTFKRMDTIAARHERAPTFQDDGMGYQLGVGMGARSQLGYTLYRNVENVKTYIDRIMTGKSPVEDIIPLDIEDRKTQFVARSLGDGNPLHLDAYERAFGCSLYADFGEAIQRLIDGGIVYRQDQRLYYTEAGKLVYDLVIVCFYPPRALDWLRGKEQSALARSRFRVAE